MFPDARAVDVPRSRFAPVKTTADLLTLRSDAYDITPDGTVACSSPNAAASRRTSISTHHYKLVDQLEAALAGGVPSLKACRNLRVKGPVRFSSGVSFEGDVTIKTASTAPVEIPPGTHRDQTLTLPSGSPVD